MDSKKEIQNVSVKILDKTYKFSVEKDKEEYFYKASKTISEEITKLKIKNIMNSDFDYLALVSIYLLCDSYKDKEDAIKEKDNALNEIENILLNIKKFNYILEDIIEIKENDL